MKRYSNFGLFVLALFFVVGLQVTLKSAPQKSFFAKPNVAINLNPDPAMPTKIPTKPVVNKKKNEEKEEANIYLNFENASLLSVLNYLGEQKKINIMPIKELEATKVSLTTRQPLTLDRAWNVLLTLMEMNGFTINKVGHLYRVVPNAQNFTEPLPVYSTRSGTEPADLPDSDQVIRYIYFFKNMKAELAQNILSTMLEGEGAVQINPDLQVAVIKEKSFNIKAAMKIIKELDTGGLRESIKIIALKEADAEVVQKLFEEILDTEKRKRLRFAAASKKTEQRYFSSSIKILAYPAKNAVILMGTEKDIQRIVNFVYKYIDVPIGTAKSRLHIKELKYAKAEELKPLLENVIKPPPGQGTEKSAIVGRYKFFEDVIIVAEEQGDQEGRGSGNRLIIASNEDDWKRLNKFIDKLDKPKPQIAFEVMIINVLIDRDRALGANVQTQEDLGMGINRLQFLNLDDMTNTRKETPETTFENGNQVPVLDANDEESTLNRLIDIPVKLANGADSADNPAYLSLGKAIGSKTGGLWAIIRSVIKSKNTNIIDQPYIVTNNGEPCTLTIGETRKVSGQLRTERGEVKVATRVDQSANTLVELTPQINLDGIVSLDIKIEVNAFVGEGLTPSKITRTIETKASLASGEVLVLGGMTDTRESTQTFKTPILGDIPILGNLFKSKRKDVIADNLYIFIRPSVIKPRLEGTPDEYTQLKLDYAKLNMMRHNAYLQDKDPIQRWFFKPAGKAGSVRVKDAKKGVFRPIDNFTYARRVPKSVDIKNDPYYRPSESIKAARKKMKQRKRSFKVV